MNKNILKNTLNPFAYVFPLYILFTFFVLFAETYKYPGIFSNYFYIDAKYFVYLTPLLGLIYIVLQRGSGSLENILINLFFKINRVAFLLLFLLYILILTLESANYPNYIFSKYHFHPDGMLMILLFNLALYLTDLFCYEINEKKIKPLMFSLSKKNTIFAFVVILFSFYFFKNAQFTLNHAIASNAYVFSHIYDDYDSKMRRRWGFFYDYMKFVKDNTPEDAVIVIPPHIRPWLSAGNDSLVRYFLYPRKLVSGNETNPPDRDYDFVIVAKGLRHVEDEMYGWPKSPVEASTVLYINDDDLSTEVIYGNFDPVQKVYEWGLIRK